jgi:hypothetical protein
VAIPSGDDVSKTGEVIGNVFENPDLMVEALLTSISA